MNKEERLELAFIPKEQWEHCIVVETEIEETFEGESLLVFTPTFNVDGDIVETAQEKYNKFLYEQENPVEPEENQTEKYINELSEALLVSEMRVVEVETVLNETSNYVLDLDTRLTNIENTKQEVVK